MKSPIDMYALRAQFAPVLAAGIPALALVYALISWQDLGLSQSVVVVGLPILMFLCSDYARQPGQALEPGIFARLGGKPSTTMLRHRDPSFSTIEKQHFHKVLSAKVDQPAPTPEEEAADPAAADAWYTRAGNWLRENTRGSKYPMVRCENIAYGYRRNALGLKTLALTTNAFIVIGCLIYLWLSWPLDRANYQEQKFFGVLVVAMLHAIYFIFVINEKSVAEAARRYGRQLLLTCEIFKEATAKPAPARKRP